MAHKVLTDEVNAVKEVEVHESGLEEDRSSHPSCPCDGSSQKGYDSLLQQTQEPKDIEKAASPSSTELADFGDTTCSRKAFARGQAQKVIAFTYFEVAGKCHLYGMFGSLD